MKVYVIIIENKPYAFSSMSTLKKQLEEMSLPFTPDIHEVEVMKRKYEPKSK